MTAVPPTIWSARRWIAKNAWTSANEPPATIAASRPSTHEFELVGAQDAEEGAVSIIPSRPMFTTPLRSENIPPIAAKASGVA